MVTLWICFFLSSYSWFNTVHTRSLQCTWSHVFRSCVLIPKKWKSLYGWFQILCPSPRFIDTIEIIAYSPSPFWFVLILFLFDFFSERIVYVYLCGICLKYETCIECFMLLYINPTAKSNTRPQFPTRIDVITFAFRSNGISHSLGQLFVLRSGCVFWHWSNFSLVRFDLRTFPRPSVNIFGQLCIFVGCFQFEIMTKF